ncbi:uncharacterized protein [Spinacia oleracea]|uniref:Agglutinin domain-containing protein n=1 Tax=Spinacia oleracea TaxID=3562 RepID=A0A9R0IZ22_SPIOL|nr:uncharacterized protein LOC110797408 [Spinacia oleracea]
MHVQLGHYACLKRIAAPFDFCLFAGSKNIDGDLRDVLTLLNLNSLFVFPKHVAFKGENGKYLGVITKDSKPCLQFSYDKPSDPKVEHEILTTPKGIVCIKSVYNKKFWRLGHGDWIVVDAEDPRGSNNARAMFRHNSLDIDAISLLNMAKTWYCKMYTLNDYVSCLNTATPNVDRYAKLEVIDLDREKDINRSCR